MAQSLSNVLLHLVFSTKNRLPWIDIAIGNQREHHRRVSYQDEYRQLLAKYEVEYDERYVWD